MRKNEIFELIAQLGKVLNNSKAKTETEIEIEDTDSKYNEYKKEIEDIIKSSTSGQHTADEIIEAMDDDDNWIKLCNYLMRSMDEVEGNVNNKDDYYSLVPAIIEPNIKNTLISHMWTVYSELCMNHNKDDFIHYISNLDSRWKWVAEKVAAEGY